MLEIFILAVLLALILFKSKNEYWFKQLNKPNINVNYILLLYIFTFFILYNIWKRNQHLTSYIILCLVLSLLWILYLFAVSNFRISLLILILIIFNMIFALSTVKINDKHYIYIYIVIFVLLMYYNFKIYTLNV